MILAGISRDPVKRWGSIHALEVLFLLPIVVALILGMVETSLILSANQQLTVASREGARVAAQGGSLSEVEDAARLALGTGTLAQKTQIACKLTDVSGDPVLVQLTVADASSVIPDPLRFVGYSIKDQPLQGAAVMRRE